jgi:hypothetical protein
MYWITPKFLSLDYTVLHYWINYRSWTIIEALTLLDLFMSSYLLDLL